MAAYRGHFLALGAAGALTAILPLYLLFTGDVLKAILIGVPSAVMLVFVLGMTKGYTAD